MSIMKVNTVAHVALASLLCACAGNAVPVDKSFASHSLAPAETVQVEKGLRAAMKDPDSARIGKLFSAKATSGLIAVCGFVNGRNSYGGYTGEQPFFGMLNGGSFAVGLIGSSESATYVINSNCSKHNVPWVGT
jgi:hypothetical protein